jgi:(p)ppGpp synthase/HD superfamily hydrolase
VHTQHDAVITQAIEFAAVAHKGGKRKGTSIPYISHPFAVGLMLAQHNCETHVIAAGILHDVVEDTYFDIGDIRHRFGDQIGDVVQGCSEDKSKSWKERKQHTIDMLPDASPGVQLVICADKLHNVQSITSDFAKLGEALWKRFNAGKEDQAWAYQGVVKSLLTIEPTPELVRELKDAVESLFGEIE